MKSVGVCLLIFVLLEAMCCEGCWKEERKALLTLKSRFDNHFLHSWVDGSDCCQWERVECNSSTGRVAKLNLENMLPYDYGHLINYSDFIFFKDLKSLDLSSNDIVGCAENEGLLTLTSLKILDLSANQINNIVDHQGSKSLSRLDVLALDCNMINGSKLRESLQAFTSIRVLSMTNSKFIGTIIAGDFCDLSNLEHLALNNNNLGNEFLKSIGELTSLKVLSLPNCGLNGLLPAAVEPPSQPPFFVNVNLPSTVTTPIVDPPPFKTAFTTLCHCDFVVTDMNASPQPLLHYRRCAGMSSPSLVIFFVVLFNASIVYTT
ncbi:Receptor protein 12 [Spatholobus suberectus]|nr:Receptor protein 12 [Spatholobus suberectus]